ncbi:MAG TPA: CHAT domain-containing protein [Thermoanaerobaculia bacterium]|nr:CHAT domain-containing protein [Thermoanaerobaculia bacterium]
MRPSLLFHRCRAARWVPLCLAVLPCGAETAPPVEPLLHDGFTQEREIRGGETQGYTVELQAGQFLRVTVQEKGIDVEVRLIDPRDALVVEADSEGLPPPQETEDLAVVAERAGLYRLLVVASRQLDAGAYRLRVEELRSPKAADLTWASAVEATWKGLIKPVGSEGEQLESLEQARTLWEELGETRKTAQLLYALGKAHQTLGDYPKAAQDFQQSSALWAQQTGSENGTQELMSLNFAALNLKRADRIEEAWALYEQALRRARELGAGGMQGIALGGLGRLAFDQGQVRRAIDLQIQGLELVHKAHDTNELMFLSDLALSYQSVAENQKAARFYDQALDLAKKLHDPGKEGLVHNNVADFYCDLGDYDKALSHWREALDLARVTKDKVREAKTLNNLGTACLRLGRFNDAGRFLDQALALAHTVKDVETEVMALSNQAFLALRTKKPALALKPSQQALALAQGTGEPEAFAHYVLGSTYRDLKRWKEAQRELEAAEETYRQRGQVLRQADIALAMARVARGSGHPDDALARVRSALVLVESARSRVVSQELRASFSAARHDFYDFLIDTLIARDLSAEALQASERARARILLEVLHESETDARQGADPALLERERNLRDEINTRESRRIELLKKTRPDPASLVEAQRGIEEALDQFQEVEASLRESSPRYAALTQPQPLTAAEIQAQVLDGKALLLEYALGEKKSFLWLVGPDKVETFMLPGRERIESVARRYYEQVTARNGQRPGETVPAWKARIGKSDQQVKQVGAELSNLILAPVEKRLGDRPLLIVAEGALQYVPFSALPLSTSGAPLISRHEIVILPSATALAALRRELKGRKPAPQELAIFADPVFQASDTRLKTPRLGPLSRMNHPAPALQPPRLRSAPELEAGRESGIDTSNLRRLPSSRQEAETIAALVPPKQVLKALGFEATKAAVTAGGLDRFRKLHFATHGLLDSRHPELSGLVLSEYDPQGKPQDGVLRLNDIYNLHLDADLVVLSACRTALGKEVRGEGLIGLTRGFMYAGAARVLASLWSVEDKATAVLMGKLYRGMLREGLSPAAALRKAQIEMANDPKRKSPYYWAGFSLQGEWR